MENTLAKLLIFAAGCLTGAAISFTVQKNRFDEKLDEDVEKATSELKLKLKNEREVVKELQEKLENYERKTPFGKFEEALKAAGVDEVHKMDQISDEPAKIIFEFNGEEEQEEDLTIYPITPEEFGANGYEEVQLYFYAADETIADAYDNIVDADDTNVGEDAIDIFIYTTAENCYIRNNETKTDYEIIKVDGSFASYESEGLYE